MALDPQTPPRRRSNNSSLHESIVFVCGPMRDGKSASLLQKAAAVGHQNVHAFRHQRDERWGKGMITSRDQTHPSLPAVHVSQLADAVCEIFTLHFRRWCIVDEAHLFLPEDLHSAAEWCAANGIVMIAAGIEIDNCTGHRFEYLNIESTIERANQARCCKCGGHSVIDVLRAQESGQQEFVPDDFIGDDQWMGLCSTCHAPWKASYGLPRMAKKCLFQQSEEIQDNTGMH